MVAARRSRGNPYQPSDFWARLDTSDAAACWNWTTVDRNTGYGVVGYQGRYWRAHRLAWTLSNGPIPSGMLVCHHCDNPPCCNPEHLFVGSAADNAADRDRKGRTGTPPPRSREHDAKLARSLHQSWLARSPAERAEIYSRAAETRRGQPRGPYNAERTAQICAMYERNHDTHAIAVEFGVSLKTVYGALSRNGVRLDRSEGAKFSWARRRDISQSVGL